MANTGFADDKDGVGAEYPPRGNFAHCPFPTRGLSLGIPFASGTTLGVVHDSSAATRTRTVSARPRTAARLPGSDIPRACARVS